MANTDLKDPEGVVRSWGFNHVFTWTDGPYAIRSVNQLYFLEALADFRRNAHYPPHSHSVLTTHLITAGELIITYPKEESPTKETFTKGARVDVDARRVHEVWIGSEGCTYVIGE